MSRDKAIKINSKCFFTVEIKDEMGDGTGFYRIIEQELHSRTFLPEGTVVFSKKDWKDFVKEIKKNKYKFKDVDEKMAKKLKDEKLDDKIEKVRKVK